MTIKTDNLGRFTLLYYWHLAKDAAVLNRSERATCRMCSAPLEGANLFYEQLIFLVAKKFPIL